MTRRYLLGLGGTVDYEIRWDPAVLAALADEHGVGLADLDRTVPVDSERALVASLLAFVRDGVGGERFVASSAIVESVARRFETRVTLGGTCVRAALAMTTLGVPSAVHLVSIDDNVRRLLPASVGVLSSADHDTLDPHLIVQYPTGTRVPVGGGEVVAPAPNRIIFANDPPHRELRLADGLADALARTDLFLISSLNVIQEPDVLEARLATLRSGVRAMPPGSLVMFEDAGYHVPAFSARVRDVMAGLADVYSMNEDEMQGYLGREVDLLDARSIAAALADLQPLVPVRTLVLHTRFWALARGERADWLRPALIGGIRMASTRYRLGDGCTAADVAQTAAMSPSAGGAALAAALADLMPAAVCVPALDLSAVAEPTTIGLGDTFIGGFLAALADR